MNTPQPSIDKIQEVQNLVQQLWSQGLKEPARRAERDALNKGYNIGSCYTEEILDSFITQDLEMLELKNTVRILQSINDPVLIQGESGTGKELIARALHGSRTRDDERTGGRFVAINCPSLSTDLMESTLFGHIKGSFTGAIDDKIGAFQWAGGGTLFIDEIGDMPLNMQSAILRALQEKVITRVGDNKEIPINPRVICATNHNLEDLVERKLFRLDLLWRLNTFTLKTKPLRERRNDIPLMLKLWDKSKKFPLDVFFSHPFNGNVRELQSLIRRWNILHHI